MLHEAHLDGVLFTPIILYCVIAAVIFVPVRNILGRIGLLQWVWHPPLFELALYTFILAALFFLTI
jgi:hypothetical protein